MIKEYYYLAKNILKSYSRLGYNLLSGKKSTFVGWDYQDENGDPLFPELAKKEKWNLIGEEKTSIYDEDDNYTEEETLVHVEKKNSIENHVQTIESENDNLDFQLQSLIDWEKEKDSDEHKYRTQEEWNDEDDDLPF